MAYGFLFPVGSSETNCVKDSSVLPFPVDLGPRSTALVFLDPTFYWIVFFFCLRDSRDLEMEEKRFPGRF